MKSKETKNHDNLFSNLIEKTKFYAHLVQFGFVIASVGILSKYFILIYKLDDIDGIFGKLFGGLADFGGLMGLAGFCVMIFGLISVALLGEKVHLYLRIGILIALALILKSFFSFSFIF